MSDDDARPEKRSIDYRDSRLVLSLLGTLYELEGKHAITKAELLGAYRDTKWKPTTIDRTIADLVDFGAVRKLEPLRGPVAYRMTTLGRAWLDRELEPGLRGLDDDVDEGTE